MIYTKEQIILSFPFLFKECTSECEFSTDDGWNDLIFYACDLIESAIDSRMNLTEEEKSECYATQIKSKFGGLRFYISFDDPYVNGIISMTEKMSLRMCEFCGQTAKQYNVKGWYWTLCPQHYEDKVKEANKK